MKLTGCLKKFITGLMLFSVLALAGAYFFLRTSLAPLDGVLRLKNLSNPVKIVRDAYGIPHIEAKNKIDAFRALGFFMASERLFQMEVSRRLIYGRLSEVLGEVALPSDKLYRSLMLKRSVERMLAAEKSQGRFDNKLWSEMEAFFDGVNQYVATTPLPYELTILGIKPEPFTPMDAYLMVGHMAYSFGMALKADPLMTKLGQNLPSELFQALRNDPLKVPLKLTGDVSSFFFQLPHEGEFIGSFEGSNAWLVSPERSASGKSIFANDPHISFSHPSVWVEAHIKTPEFELYGHYLPLIPYAILGHNAHHAWGFTMSLADDMDLYRESLDYNKKSALYKNAALPFTEWHEVIKVKKQPDFSFTMIETSHGPIMDQVLDEKNLALKWAFHSTKNNPLKSLKEMAEAKRTTDFEKALQYGSAPGLNVLYADASNIAWWIFGDVAVKRNPNSDLILDGSSGADEYERLLNWKEKPYLINPASGIIVSANSRPMGLQDNIRGEFQSDDRYQTIIQALSEKQKWSAEDFKILQTRNYNAQTKNILSQLLSNLKLTESEKSKYQKQLHFLRQWNFTSDISSTAATFYYEWNNQNILLMLNELDKNTKEAYLNTSYAWSFYRRAILNKNSSWWNNKDFGDLVTEGFKQAALMRTNNQPWGKVHTIEYRHPLGKTFPLNLVFNLGPYEIPGAYNDINNNKMKHLGGNFDVTAGPSTRRIIDFTEPQKSWGINPIGISGHMLSPFYKDQVQMFLEGKYRLQLMAQEDIEKSKTHELVLENR